MISQLISKRKRQILDIETKYLICSLKNPNPEITFKSIKEKMLEKYHVDVGLTTIKDTVKRSDFYLTKIKNKTSTMLLKKTSKSAKYENLEEAIFLWLNQKNSEGIPVSDEIVIEKAKYFGLIMNIENFKYSHGWLSNFKNRFNIKSFKYHGEANEVNKDDVEFLRKLYKNLLKDYDPETIYNLDETGIFYELGPNQTLSTYSMAGKKVSKNRVTAVLCCNSNGSDKLKLTVIGKAAKPRSFANFNVFNYVNYYHNSKGWMTSLIFHDILKQINEQMKKCNRNIVLLVDNAPSHKLNCIFTNVKIEYLPPNCTSHLQPLDMGIIRSVKAIYRKNILTKMIEYADESKVFKPSIKDCILFLFQSWNNVTSSTISNCFKKTGILEGHFDKAEICKDANDLENFIDEKNLSCDTKELIENSEENVTENQITDELIINLVNKNVSTESEDEDKNEPLITIDEKFPLQNIDESIKKIESFILIENNNYIEGWENLNKSLTKTLNELRRYLEKKH